MTFERDPDDKGLRHVWLTRDIVDQLAAMRGPKESYSGVIIRIAAVERGS